MENQTKRLSPGEMINEYMKENPGEWDLADCSKLMKRFAAQENADIQKQRDTAVIIGEGLIRTLRDLIAAFPEGSNPTEMIDLCETKLAKCKGEQKS